MSLLTGVLQEVARMLVFKLHRRVVEEQFKPIVLSHYRTNYNSPEIITVPNLFLSGKLSDFKTWSSWESSR